MCLCECGLSINRIDMFQYLSTTPDANERNFREGKSTSGVVLPTP